VAQDGTHRLTLVPSLISWSRAMRWHLWIAGDAAWDRRPRPWTVGDLCAGV